ncbi:MAG: TolC family protein [Planctomycetes bacterium]|nr:TolC family protein [Planctomycetota bacterium]
MGAVLPVLVLVACVKVDPSADFRLAREAIRESTGVRDVYAPESDPISEAEINVTVQDGLALDEALRLALVNNRGLQSDFLEIGIARSDLVQSGLFSNPSLALSVQFPEGGGRSNLQTSLAQNIVDLWQIPARKRVAQSDLDQAVLRLARLANVLAIDARRSYFAAVAAQDMLQVAQENLQLVEKSVRTIRAQREAGAASQLDENLARGQVLNAQLAQIAARLEAVNSKRRLARLLSIEADMAQVMLTDPLPGPLAEGLTAEALVPAAREHRLDLRALDAGVRSAESKVRLEYLDIFPEVSVGPFLERGERRASPGRDVLADTARASIASGALTAPDIQSRGQRRKERRQEIDAILGPAMTMTLPIFDQNQAQIAKAKYQYEQAVKSFEASYLAIAQDIRMGVERANTASRNVAFYRDELLPQAQRNLDIATSAFNAGGTSILAVLEAQRSFLEARRGLLTARAEAASAWADLELAVGVPLVEMRRTPAPASQPLMSEIIGHSGQ